MMSVRKVMTTAMALAVPGLAAMLSTAGLLAGCGSSYVPVASDKPDYSQEANWLALPGAQDTKEVDVFFLYPTAYQQSSESDPIVCSIDNTQMRSGAQSALTRTASAFETVANIYAPYYEQAALQILSLPYDQQQSIVGGKPTSDAIAAFDHYIRHDNMGRPFILAGHSQGSNIMIYLLADRIAGDPDLLARMIAAYVIGYSITPEYLQENPGLRFATGPDDTGVIVSYNTAAPETTMPNPVVLPGALVINPITWTTDQTLATADQNLGGIALDASGHPVSDAEGNPQKVLGYADAQVDTAKGELICSTADPDTLAPGNEMVAAGIYHSFDYPFYYFDLRANAENRIARFLGQE